jgi:sterol desaturase/sphingolipid hydroxylase (fatty acid hydroxylase superfamily)
MDATLEVAFRIGCAAALFALLAGWEWLAPRRPLWLGRLRRWPGNLGIVAVDTLVVRLLVPTAVVGAALTAAGNGTGLFHWLNLRLSVATVLGFLILDLAIYLQHVAFHHIPWLWPLHRMHHADLDIDVTTGFRFHPFEILISLGIKIAVVMAFGIPPVAVFVFEAVLNATSLFNHSNISVRPGVERLLRLVVVTPDMHRVHHSVLRAETDSNFGFNLPWWDWLFGTYRREPQAGHNGMTIGLPIFRSKGELRLDRMLTQPFRSDNRETDRKTE